MRARRGRGFSLVEMALVLALLALLAVVALPAEPPSRAYKLELAAGEVADAYRFARSEALRTGTPHGTFTQPGQDRVRVYRADMGASPPTPIYDVHHPVSRRLYDVDLKSAGPWQGVDLAASSTWLGTCDEPRYVLFDARGTPHCRDPYAVLLDQASLQLSFAGETRDVVVDGETGRVREP